MNRSELPRAVAIFAALALFSVLQGCSKTSDELVIYSARKDHLIQPVLALYTQQTGTQVRLVTDKAGALIQRLIAEGDSTPADLLVTVDAGTLWQAADRGVLQPIESKPIAAAIPDYLRDPGNQWVGLSLRARTIVYNPTKVTADEFASYEALADAKWKGRLCLRTSKKVYNQSLIATLIEAGGEPATETMVRGWVDNLATAPFSSDTKVLEAIAAGQCDVGIVNTYYLGRLQRDQPGIPLAIFWPNQTPAPGEVSGVHINISGAGVTRHAPQPQAAAKFLEWLTGRDAQKVFADANLEYPANSTVEPSALVTGWGEFEPSKTNLAVAGQRQAEAVRLMDRAGYR